MRFGLQLWSQQTDWPGFRDAALAAEEAGWDSIWTWDHLLAIFGPWEQPIFEGWSVLAGLGPLTSQGPARADGRRQHVPQPGHTAKLATTLDHLSGGRAVLGIGGAWFEREHDAFGIDFGSGFGERLDRLDESVMLMRRLLDGERFSHEGRFYTFHDALSAPRPVQPHLPILVGGSGPTKTLRTVAVRADAWNTSGTLEEVRARLEILAEHAADVGRDLGTIEMTVSFPIILRDDRRGGRRVVRALLAHNGAETWAPGPVLLGSPAEVADAIRPYASSGSRPSSSGCRRPTTARPSRAWPEVQELLARVKVVALAGGTGGAKLAHGLQPVLAARRADGHRQHRRRHRAPRPPRHAGPRRGHVHARRPLRRRAGLGHRRRDVGHDGRCSSDTARRPGSASATATSRPTSSGRAAQRAASR